ncbi:acyl-CoA thioesterase II [Pseudorhodoferax sp. Leaf267]|uniref:acyl-CoA thioesterase n=1 Tax=Pseudorhodoferax sp. Leaf267 TaxID=1736316 RepID=UPI0006FDFA10|nr:acyl-CoA thioesterase II [Pseudorhodoferax sp. Leaf267]KQP13133.1 acyl-CoA thioesterase II [Pseudorhodoferax sp. Leaf267]
MHLKNDSAQAPEVRSSRREALHALVEQLRLEQLEKNLFRGTSSDIGAPAVFGGQVLGQALMAAARTVDAHAAHSLHGYFLRAGDKKAPIVYDVERIRDGGSFTTRRVVAVQHGEAIFTMSASFHRREAGVEHQRAMPAVPGPDTLQEQTHQPLSLPIDFRFADGRPPLGRSTWAPAAQTWLRTVDRLPDDPLLHQAMLAYASDYSLLGVAMQPHGLDFRNPKVQGVSLDHAMWFHRDFRCDDWLLYEADSPSAYGSRGFCRGSLFSHDGQLVASVAQEGLVRVRA